MPDSPFSGTSATLAQILPPEARRRILRYAPFLLLLGLLVLCGYLAARLSWQFAAPAATSVSTHTETAAQGAAGAGDETPGDKIAAAHLFGTANAPAADVAARNAPETSLDLGLAGVAAGNSKGLSYAIVTSNGNKADTYAVGAKLPDGALIRRILPDRIILAHNGRLETLRLPNAGTSILAAPVKAGEYGMPRTYARKPPPLASRSFREQVQSHPGSFSDYMQLRPYDKNGHMAGYRVYPGKQPALFKKAGLVPGDIVTGVNGVTLDSPASSLKAIRELRQAQGPIRLEILRKGHRMSVTINLGG
ncbi:MAG: type II secretion system protein GspC [Gammaproteobacteria bacterium]